VRWIAKWYVYSCKRLFKKPLFFLLLLSLPIGMRLFWSAEKESGGTISIALYTDGDDFNEQAADALIREAQSFDFYRCGSEEALRADVAAGRAECGYCFPAGLKERLNAGDYKRAIRVVTSPSTVASGIASESVYAGLFSVYGRELLRQYAVSGEAFAAAREIVTAEGIWEELEPLYDAYLENGSTFAFAYETVAGAAVEETQALASFPVRGMGAVFILVMGLGAAVTAGEDERRGLYLAMTGAGKTACQLMQIGAAVSFAALSVLTSFAVSGSLPGPCGPGALFREGAALALYGASAAVFSWGLLTVVKKPQAIAGLIPFFILGSLAVCPVFADLSRFIPVIKIIRWGFLPWYYLRL
jgi:hypothetical protein